ncbi:uncharacterized protein LOC113295387 [Papaver somniferum]|uniref:uncharacterized protein LOC113295387 n=1 Tax=Papaver somniferum TaxID=3469 RepID=UPI000E6F620A|nr:uncharacterized protein LOC113295387 [Papaver somniferum]
MAYVWVQLPGLSIEYWKEKILMNIGKALGRPIKVDETTLKKEARFYANILVEMDLAKGIPSKINVESKYGKFKQAVNILNMPKFCHHCKIVGHYTAECRNKKREQEKSNDVNEIPKATKQIWRRVTKKKTQPPIGLDLCPPVDQEIPSTSSLQVLETPLEKTTNSEFPALSVEKLLNATAGAPTINKSSTIIPPIGKKVSNENAPKVKQKTQQGSVVTTRQQAYSLVTKSTLLPDFCKKLKLPGMHYEAIDNSRNGKKGNIWILWNSSIQKPNILFSSDQSITVEVGDTLITGIHAASLTVNRLSMWKDLVYISYLNKPWLVMGDFNTIMREDEKKGGLKPLLISMLEFNNCLHSCGLIQAPNTGLDFSWCNNRAGRRRIVCNLDRAVFNDKWLDKFSR